MGMTRLVTELVLGSEYEIWFPDAGLISLPVPFIRDGRRLSAIFPYADADDQYSLPICRVLVSTDDRTVLAMEKLLPQDGMDALPAMYNPDKTALDGLIARYDALCVKERNAASAADRAAALREMADILAASSCHAEGIYRYAVPEFFAETDGAEK